MCSPRPPSRFLPWVMSLVATAFAMSPDARAQTGQSTEDVDTPGLTIEAIAGWDGVVDRSAPIPLSFLIRNDSEQIIEGDIQLSNPWTGQRLMLGEVVVAPGTSRRLTSIQALTDWYICFATLNVDDRVLWRRELAVSTGSEFNADSNFVLFIDDGGRRLRLPGSVDGTTPVATANSTAGTQGRSVRSLSVKTWQVPDHPGPLIAARAIVFPEGAAVEDLNLLQWAAVSEWTCLGGAVFVHNTSPEIIDRLVESAPLDAEDASSSGALRMRPLGLGAVYEYPESLLSSGDNPSRQQVSAIISKMPSNHVSTLVDAVYSYNRRGGRADLNRVMLIIFFGFYALLSGVVSMLLFRLTRRQIAAYTVVAVVGASALSGLLGGYLRFSSGDLCWVTLTQAGPGGAVQVGRIELQSAGGRDTHVAVHGDRADLQYIEGDRGYYRWHQPAPKFPPFTWQPNLASGVDDTYQIQVPITPWGRRQCHATAYMKGFEQLDVELEFETSQSGGSAAELSSGPVPGEFSLKLTNRLPFDIQEGWLVVGVSGAPDDQSATSSSSQVIVRTPSGLMQVSAASGGNLYQIKMLRPVAAGASLDESFTSNFVARQNDWDVSIQWDGGTLTPPRVAYPGAVNAWIIAILDESPAMTIDGQRSDFVPHDELHVYIQEIHPGNMPDASLFADGGDKSEDNGPLE